MNLSFPSLIGNAPQSHISSSQAAAIPINHSPALISSIILVSLNVGDVSHCHHRADWSPMSRASAGLSQRPVRELEIGSPIGFSLNLVERVITLDIFSHFIIPIVQN